MRVSVTEIILKVTIDDGGLVRVSINEGGMIRVDKDGAMLGFTPYIADKGIVTKVF